MMSDLWGTMTSLCAFGPSPMRRSLDRDGAHVYVRRPRPLKGRYRGHIRRQHVDCGPGGSKAAKGRTTSSTFISTRPEERRRKTLVLMPDIENAQAGKRGETVSGRWISGRNEDTNMSAEDNRFAL